MGAQGAQCQCANPSESLQVAKFCHVSRLSSRVRLLVSRTIECLRELRRLYVAMARAKAAIFVTGVMRRACYCQAPVKLTTSVCPHCSGTGPTLNMAAISVFAGCQPDGTSDPITNGTVFVTSPGGCWPSLFSWTGVCKYITFGSTSPCPPR